MSPREYIMGLFTDEPRAVLALRDLKRTRWNIEQVHSPVPSEEINQEVGCPKSRVGYFTLTGGIFGFFAGVALATYTAVQWHLVVSGKPVVAWIPFFVVGFELAILFAVIGNIIGLLLLSRLPRLKAPEHYDERCTGTHFGILVSCPKGQSAEIEAFFRERGGAAEKQ